jgi:glycosyltransferase involved in cell wall biosynthesis
MKRATAGDRGASLRAHLWAGRRLCRAVISEGLSDARGVYAFNSAGLELLSYAKSDDLFTIVEQTIAPRMYQQELMDKEVVEYPEWTTQVASRYDNEIQRFSDREQEEWQLADTIICGSEFVKNAIGECGGPVHRCHVVPYGVDAMFRLPARANREGPLRVLCVGSVGLRKGSHYILEAAKLCGSAARFRLVGSVHVPEAAQKKLNAEVDIVGHVPRSEIIEHYRWADVFLLPSLCEGSAAVTYEAMAGSLPVICTPHTGSIVRDGKEGFIVPIRDPEAISERIHQLAEDRELCHVMGNRARARYEQSGSLKSYADRLLEAMPLAPVRSP